MRFFLTIFALMAMTSLFAQKDVKVDGKLTVTGATLLQGDVKTTKLPTANTLDKTGNILVTDADGVLKVMPPDVLQADVIYKPVLCTGNEPVWVNGTNKLYTNCPLITNVGIGTSTPDFNLEVIGDTRISHRLNIGGVSPVTNTLLAIEAGNASGIRLNQSTTSLKNSLMIMNNDIPIFRVYSTGQMESRFSDDAWSAFSIKDAADENIFYVTKQGAVVCTKVIVQMYPFPDYVFEPGYKLRSLYDLEKYIKQNKHLPNMPTAAEISEEGADLNELNRILVEKVEELTLYVVDLQKQIDASKTVPAKQ